MGFHQEILVLPHQISLYQCLLECLFCLGFHSIKVEIILNKIFAGLFLCKSGLNYF